MITAFRPAMPTAEDQALSRAIQSLSPREREVCELIAAGLANDDIAKRLTISRYTVKVHVSNILGKLGVPDRVHVVLAWSRLRGHV
jgi:RNA polymerase sigma factor (sigma-70 family)